MTTDSTASEEDMSIPPPIPAKQREYDPDYSNLPKDDDQPDYTRKPPIHTTFVRVITKKVKFQLDDKQENIKVIRFQPPPPEPIDDEDLRPPTPPPKKPFLRPPKDQDHF